MIRIAQFGEGNFLRTFVDAYFQTLNEEGGDYAVSIIKPIPMGSLENFARQNNRYHIVLRGTENGCDVERVYPISVVTQTISPFEEAEAFYSLARDPDLQLIVSNTTEAGICFCDADRLDGFADITFPAKLTKFLYERFRAGLGGVHLLPVELIENNADELYRCVDKYIHLWELPDSFKIWNDTKNFYCSTLVDRIVSGHPRDDETKTHLADLIGETDALVSVGEPFGLWVIEKKGAIDSYIKEGKHNIDVVLCEDIHYFKKRKVRVLNGSHTNLVSAGLVLGKSTVYDCMTDERLHHFFLESLREIIPFVSDDIAATKQFAADVEQRFLNPYLHHQLRSIALNSISKWKARVLPTFRDYYEKNGKIPVCLTIGFAYLMHLYRTDSASLNDDAEILADFGAGRPLADIMGDTRYWGEDLLAYTGFFETVTDHLERMQNGEILL